MPLPEVTDISEIDTLVEQILAVAQECIVTPEQGGLPDHLHTFIPAIYARMAARGIYLPDGCVFSVLKTAGHFTGLWTYIGEGYFKYNGKFTGVIAALQETVLGQEAKQHRDEGGKIE